MKEPQRDVSKLVPWKFSLSVLDFVVDDLIWNDITKTSFRVKKGKDQLRGMNDSSCTMYNSWAHLYVIEYADRPNTGKQPVADDVVSDVAISDIERTLVVKDFSWDLGIGAATIKSWKPNHAYMVKASKSKDVTFHAEQFEEALESVKKSLPNMLKAAEEFDEQTHKRNTAVDTLEQMNYSYNGAQLWKPPIGEKKVFAEDVTPVFTQSMFDAGIDAPIGSRVLYLAGVGIKKEDNTFTKGYWDETTVIARHNGMVWLGTHGIQGDGDIKPIQTEEDKLREAMIKISEQSEWLCDEISMVETMVDFLMASTDFTITLNKG